MSNAIYIVPEDGIYQYPNGQRVQYLAGHVLDISAAGNIKKVSEFPTASTPALSPVEIQDATPEEPQAKAALEPDNKMDSGPEDK